MFRRVPKGTYKLGPDAKAKVEQRLRAFEKRYPVGKRGPVQRREIYRLRAIQRGQHPGLKRDVGSAGRGLIPGMGPGPQNVFAGMGLASIGAKVAAPAAAKGLFYVARGGAAYMGLQTFGRAVETTVQPAHGKPGVRFPLAAPTQLEPLSEEIRRMRKRRP